MNILAIDTSSMTQSVALSRDGIIVDHVQMRAKGGHAQQLAPIVDGMLTRHGLVYGDISELVVGVGPGSFTGLRIGLAFAKGVAAAVDATVRGVPSLEAMATLLPAGGRLLVAQDARKAEVYGGVYRTGLANETLVQTDTWDPVELAAATAALDPESPLWLAGNGLDVYADGLKGVLALGTRLDATLETPTATALLRYRDAFLSDEAAPSAVEPVYIRPSEAEIGLKKRLEAASSTDH